MLIYARVLKSETNYLLLFTVVQIRKIKDISFSFSFHSLCTVTPSAKAAFQGAVKNFTILKFKIQYIQ